MVGGTGREWNSLRSAPGGRGAVGVLSKCARTLVGTVQYSTAQYCRSKSASHFNKPGWEETGRQGRFELTLDLQEVEVEVEVERTWRREWVL